MRLFSILPAMLAGAIALGCAGDPTQPSADLGEPHHAVVFHERTQIIGSIMESSCTGELIELSGTSHEKISLTETATGVFHLRFYFHIHGVGTGLTTGASFVLDAVEVSIFPDVEESFFQGTDEFTTVLIGQAGAPNEVIRFKYHLTLNANGTTTSSFEDFTIRCT